MDFIKDYSKIKVNDICQFDINGILEGIYPNVKTVIIMKSIERTNASPLIVAKSIDTEEEISADASYFQADPEFLKKEYIKLLKEYQVDKSELIIYYNNKLLIVIGILSDVNNLLTIDKNGIVHQLGFEYSTLNLKRNKSFDMECEAQFRDI